MAMVLVTGAAGFIGSHVTEALLSRGDSVVGLDNFDAYYEPALKRRNVAAFSGPFKLIEADVRSDTLHQSVQPHGPFDSIIHLAALAGVRSSIERPAAYVDVNGRGTANVLELAYRLGVNHVVHGSSSSVYGDNPGEAAETDPIDRPLSPYAASKQASEALCYAAHHVRGLDVSVLRFFTVYGPRQRPDMAISLFSSLMLAGKPVPMFGDGTTKRDYTFVLDIVDGILRALDSGRKFRIYNLGSGSPVRLSRMIETLAVEWGVKANIESLPPAQGDVVSTCAHIGHARQELGYSPKTTLEQGVKAFAAWYRGRNERPSWFTRQCCWDGPLLRGEPRHLGRHSERMRTTPEGSPSSPTDSGSMGDAGRFDVGPVDAGPVDAGPVDAGPVDAGPVDAGPVDAGPVDAGPVDAGPVDAGPVDAGPADAGPCPMLMAYVPMGDAAFCVDLYEGAVVQQVDGGEMAWPFNQPVDALATGTFRAVPADAIDPQGYISAEQGSAACQASGKRLCSLAEWLAACEGPDGYTYPYGNTYESGACNEGNPSPVYEIFGSNPSFDDAELNDPRLDMLPNTVAPGGTFAKCVSAYGVFDMHGNVEEWVQDTTSSGHGIFKGGYFVDATINGPGCHYETTAHATDYHDYSTGFRCCADP